MKQFRIGVHFTSGEEKVFNQPDRKLYEAFSQYVCRRHETDSLPASWELLDEDRTVLIDLDKVSWMSVKEVAVDSSAGESPTI